MVHVDIKHSMLESNLDVFNRVYFIQNFVSLVRKLIWYVTKIEFNLYFDT